MTIAASAQRRPLRFGAIDEALADAEALVAADAAGRLSRHGRWTLGQALDHLATWIDYAYEGIPLKVPLPLRWLIRPFKRRMLTRPMRAGVRVPGVPGGTLAIADVPIAEALDHFRRSCARLVDQAPTQPHMIFGPLTHAEWILLHLRHAELHLSFFAGRES